jgi:hypothetical protein
MGFLDNYEASRARLERWWLTYPNGRIETRIVEFSAEKGFVLIEAKAFRNAEDMLPAGIDFAFGYQAAYQKNMARWFVEDTTTSAIMRVQQLVMGGAERSTQETMQQVENLSAKEIKPVVEYDVWAIKHGEIPSYKEDPLLQDSGIPTLGSTIEEITTQLGSQLVEEKPRCKHGTRIWKEGKSEKTGKAWGGYFCTEKTKATQCEPVWYMLGSDGQWRIQL